MTPDAKPGSGNGVLLGAGAYLLWGLFPLYFVALKPSPPLEVLSHRIVWSAVFCVIVLTLTRTWPRLIGVLRIRRTVGLLTLAALLIAANWFVYVAAVTTGHVVESALGYYINPLVTVLLGVIFLRERLRPLQWAACGLALAAVLVLSVAYGRVPWIAFALAFSFGLYGLVKNMVGRSVQPLDSLTAETAVLFLPALGVLVAMGVNGTLTFGHISPVHTGLLAFSGVATAIPLILFAAAAARIPLSMVGLLQYLTPTTQLLIGVFVLGEQMSTTRWIGFGFIWVALVVLSVDMLRRARRRPLPPVTEPT